jgi:hypothetical protein
MTPGWGGSQQSSRLYKPFMNLSNSGGRGVIHMWALSKLETAMFIGAVLALATAATWATAGV